MSITLIACRHESLSRLTGINDAESDRVTLVIQKSMFARRFDKVFRDTLADNP